MGTLGLSFVHQFACGGEYAVYLRYYTVSMENNFEYSESINSNLSGLEAGVDLNLLVIRPLFSPGFYVGAGHSVMKWKYIRPLLVDNPGGSGYSIDSDAVQGMDLHMGINMNLGGSGKSNVSITFVPGMKIWFGATKEGFENNVFDHLMYLNLLFTMKFFGNPH